MLTYLRPALVLTVLFILLTGVAYPLAITGIGQLAFPAQANGSLIRNGDTVVGSALIGQNFASDRYFWPRPSVTADTSYNAAASTGSNLGSTSAALARRVQADVERLKTSGMGEPVAADAATASGSGLDPHISPQFAKAQAARVAKARGLSNAEISALVDSFTEDRLAAIVGEPRVNVLRLNLALDQLKS